MGGLGERGVPAKVKKREKMKVLVLFLALFTLWWTVAAGAAGAAAL
jgi:hypothetical protein